MYDSQHYGYIDARLLPLAGPVNHSPVAVDDVVSTYTDMPIYILVTSNDIFQDSDGDGIQDLGENGVVATVQLLDASGNVMATVPSDNGGIYSFMGVSAGSYRVRVLPPPGSTGSFSPKDMGSDDTQDSDVNNAGESDLFTLLAGEMLTHLDAGWH